MAISTIYIRDEHGKYQLNESEGERERARGRVWPKGEKESDRVTLEWDEINRNKNMAINISNYQNTRDRNLW